MNKLSAGIGNQSKTKLQKALAVLIKNTKTTRRQLSLLEIAEWLDIAVEGLGSINAVSDRIGISAKMLGQFQYVKKLSPNLQKLIASRKIDSVDIVVHLSMLNESDQIVIAQEIASSKLDSADIRAIRDLRKSNPKTDIREIIHRVKASKNVKQYIAEFIVRSKATKREILRQRFARIIGDENIISLEIKGPFGVLTMNSQGRKNLEEACKEKGVTKGGMVVAIAEGAIA
jgi:hypothetical protein